MRDQQRIAVGGVCFDPVDDRDLAVRVSAALARGTGGWATLPELDVIVRAFDDPMVQEGLATADLVVACGATLMLASRLAGARLPAQSGSALIWSVMTELRNGGRSVYLLGGEPETASSKEGAHRAAAVLSFACPGIVIAGHASPTLGAATESSELAAICDEIVEAAPDVVVVGLDVARQAWMAAHLRRALPATWFLGWAGAIEMMVGTPARRRVHRPAASRAVRLLARAATAGPLVRGLRSAASRSTRSSRGTPAPGPRPRRSADRSYQ